MNMRLPPSPAMVRIRLHKSLARYERTYVAMVAECPPGVEPELHAASIAQVVGYWDDIRDDLGLPRAPRPDLGPWGDILQARSRSRERDATQQAAFLRQQLQGVEKDIAEHPSEPSAAADPKLHRVYLEGMVSWRDDLRREMGMPAVIVTSSTGDSGMGRDS